MTPHKESQSPLIGAWIRNEEEKKLVLSSSDKKLSVFKSNEDKNNLIKAITSWRLHLGIREKMSDEELIINMNFLKESYPNITLEDVRLAIKYSLNGTLGMNPETFGSFSPLYISKVINSYLVYKREEMIAIQSRKNYHEFINKKEPELTYAEKVWEKKNLIKWYFNKLQESDKYVGDYGHRVWTLLNDKGLLLPDEIDWADAEEKAEILKNKNFYSTFAKAMMSMNPVEKEEEAKRLKEMYGRYYLMKQYFAKVTDIDVWIGQFSDEDILPSTPQAK